MLKYYYQGREQLEISGEGYTIFIRGSDICNYENELYTQIPFRETPEGIVFEINHGKELCGEVDLELTKYAGNYLYLYNASKDRYQLLQTDNISRLHITQEGTYLLTKEKLANHKIKRAALAGSVGILVIMGIVYIGVKKKYWFW